MSPSCKINQLEVQQKIYILSSRISNYQEVKMSPLTLGYASSPSLGSEISVFWLRRNTGGLSFVMNSLPGIQRLFT